MVLIAVSVVGAGLLLLWTRRSWLPLRDARLWWRSTVLTGTEDLRIGAVVSALAAAVSATGSVIAADVSAERLGPARPVNAVVVSRAADAAVVELLAPLTRAERGLRLRVSELSAQVGTDTQVYVTRSAAVVDDEQSTGWNVWSISSILLLVLAGSAAAMSLLPNAGRRLVPYRALSPTSTLDGGDGRLRVGRLR